MNNARQRFIDELSAIKNLSGLHVFLRANYSGPCDVEDVSRTKVVWAVSAFDKLVHDLVRIGMVQIFTGTRVPTPKYLSEPVPLSTLNATYSQPLVPAASVFEQVVFGKLKHLSLQDPRKLGDGLSLIWAEPHKWQVLAANMGTDADTARTTLSLIASRRNSIVHEADLDPITHSKILLTLSEAQDVVDFLERLGLSICKYVI